MTGAHARRRRPAGVPAFLGKAVRLPRPKGLDVLSMAPPAANEVGGFASKQVNNLVVCAQQLDNWCWAAVMQSVILDRKRIEISQATIASDHRGRICGLQDVPSKAEDRVQCHARPCSAACNDPHALQNLLQEHEVWRQSNNLGDRKNWTQEIKIEIDQQRPVPIMLYVETDRDLIHFAMIGGYSDGNFFLYFPVEDRQARVLTPIFVTWDQIKYPGAGFHYNGHLWHGANLYFLRN